MQEISLGSICRARWAVGPSEFLAAHEATAVTLTCQAHSIQVHMLPERRRSLALARAMIVAGLPLAQRTALARQLRQRWSACDVWPCAAARDRGVRASIGLRRSGTVFACAAFATVPSIGVRALVWLLHPLLCGLASVDRSLVCCSSNRNSYSPSPSPQHVRAAALSKSNAKAKLALSHSRNHD